MAYKRSQQRRLAEKQAVDNLPSHIYQIESIDLEGQGVAHHEGKVIFISGGLTGERVQAQLTRSKPSYDKARVINVIKSSSQRVMPACVHFGVCGGCSLQHVDVSTQIAVKQRALEDQLLHIGKLTAELIIAPIAGFSWGYRYRARLSVKYVAKKNTVLVGFHERANAYIADIQSCAVLPRHVSDLLLPLRALIGKLTVKANVPQIEVAVGEIDTVLLMRHLEPLTADDVEHMRRFAIKNSQTHHALVWYTQSGNGDTIAPLDREIPGNLHYTLPAFNISMPFKVSDFTQVNHPMNRVLVSKALTLLAPKLGERVLDLFCGLGNFTLPLARMVSGVEGQSGYVLGVEGSLSLTARAQDNAVYNGLTNTAFEARNLFEVTTEAMYDWGAFDRWLIDPPREGAQAVCEAMLNLPASHRPKRMVYVSCNPATLARDARIVCSTGKWSLSKAGIANMFPHTSHVESIAVFEPI
jgi:23S rRNA (uracil1939-C5)-methyltransferase